MPDLRDGAGQGVGAAGFAARRIDALGLRDALRALAQPVLGICLGMQLLFEHSEEDDAPGLGILPGRVRRITPAPGRTADTRTPSAATSRAKPCGKTSMAPLLAA